MTPSPPAPPAPAPPPPPALGRFAATPAAAGPGVVITATIVPADNQIWIHGILTLDPPRAARVPIDAWLRALVGLAVSEGNQHPYIRGLIGDRLVTADEIEPPRDGLVSVAFNFPLVAGLALPARGERYFVQVSARELRSNVLKMAVAGGSPTAGAARVTTGR